MSAYALSINQKYPDKNPVRYVVLTNGIVFIVYPWDNELPIFYLRFEDFQRDNERWLNLRSNLSYSAFKQVSLTKNIFKFERPELSLLIKTFNDLHDLIRKKDSKGPTDAFYELSKIMFIKIREDDKIHAILKTGAFPKKEDFIFQQTGLTNKQKF